MAQTSSIREIIDRNGIMVIDGSMSTALENLGANLNSKLWTAKALEVSPELVRQVHLDYFKAGADCGITCSYQATIPGLMNAGCTREEAEKLIARSVELFIEARKEWWEEEGEKEGRMWPLCLAGIGPYGAFLADGSEYRGHYGVSDEVLDEFHRRRMEILHESTEEEWRSCTKQERISCSLRRSLPSMKRFWRRVSRRSSARTIGSVSPARTENISARVT